MVIEGVGLAQFNNLDILSYVILPTCFFKLDSLTAFE